MSIVPPLYPQPEGADYLASLPTKSTPMPPHVIQTASALFGEKKKGFSLSEFKEAIIVGIIILALSLPPVDAFLSKMCTAGPYVLASLKAVLAVVLYWVINKFYLSRNVK